MRAGMTPFPYRTLDEVVDGLSHWEARLQADGDRRAIFATLYGVVSAEIRERVETGAFGDNQWVRRYAVTFANFYRQALEDDEAGRSAAVPKAWRLAFEAARAGNGLVLQDLLLGVNAHVNNDLPLALTAVTIDPERQSRYDDHARVNGVLASVTDRASERIAALYAPGLPGLDACAGELDEMLSLFSLQVARESAWEAAVALANARSNGERALVTRLIGSRAAVLARVLRTPSLSPSLIAACRRLEAGINWAALIMARGQ